MELKKVDKKVEDIKSNNNIYSVGKVIKVNPYTVIVSGLNDITYYEEVDIAGKAKGFVFAVGKNNITVSLVDVNDKINPGVPFEVVNPKPNRELLEALQEGKNILNGKTKAKSYTNMYEMLKDLES